MNIKKIIRKTFFLVVCAVFVGLLSWVGCLYVRFSHHDCAPLRIRTFDFHNDPYHPSVKYFPNGWNGYKYWMVESPFSPDCLPRRDANEVPEIQVSQDGVHWEWPGGLENPLVRLTRYELDDYVFCSDPHIVMRGDIMEVWYRRTNWDGKQDYMDHSLRKVVSTDGVHWSEEIIVTEVKNNERLLRIRPEIIGYELVSPVPIYQSERNGYAMYFVSKLVDSKRKQHLTVELSYLRDGEEWTPARTCHLHGASVNPWHIDVQCFDGIYWLTVLDDSANQLSLWKSTDGLNFIYARTLLEGGIVGSFYGNKLYRACLVKAENRYLLYFTGDDGYNSYIGLMEGDSPETLEIVAVDGNHRNYLDFVVGVCYRMECLFAPFSTKVRRRFRNY